MFSEPHWRGRQAHGYQICPVPWPQEMNRPHLANTTATCLELLCAWELSFPESRLVTGRAVDMEINGDMAKIRMTRVAKGEGKRAE